MRSAIIAGEGGQGDVNGPFVVIEVYGLRPRGRKSVWERSVAGDRGLAGFHDPVIAQEGAIADRGMALQLRREIERQPLHRSFIAISEFNQDGLVRYRAGSGLECLEVVSVGKGGVRTRC